MIDLLGTARSSIARHRMLRPGDRVLVAVSGGPDSLALLSVLTALRKELKFTLRAAYVDHRLRPAAAKKEAALVRRLGREWKVPVTVLTRRVSKEKKNSLESSARAARYQALAALAKELRCGAIATGHTADDQAETVLLWILRGVGFTGLAGIPPVRMEGKARIIRPLLQVSRKEVEAYLKTRGIRPLLDRSNLSRRYARNRIRHALIPQLEREYNPQLRRHLAVLAELVRDETEWISQETASRFRSVARIREQMVRLDRSKLKKAHPALRRELLRLAVRRLQGGHSHGFSERHWRLLEKLAVDGIRGAMDLPHRLRAEVLEKGLLLKVSVNT